MPSAPIIEIEIEIQPGKMDKIIIYQGDIPAQVAKEFCERNGLGGKIEIVITRMIQQQIEAYQAKRRKRASPQRQRSPEFSQPSQASGSQTRGSGGEEGISGGYYLPRSYSGKGQTGKWSDGK